MALSMATALQHDLESTSEIVEAIQTRGDIASTLPSICSNHLPIHADELDTVSFS